MDVLKIFLLSVIIAVVCMLVKHYKPEYSLLCEICGVLFVVGLSISSLTDIISVAEELSSECGIDFSFVKILIKALLISLFTDISVSVCRDSGNSALANGVEFFGKAVIVALSLPMIGKVVDIAVGFIK